MCSNTCSASSHMGASQIIGSGTRSGTIPLFRTSDPYVIIHIIILYIYITIFCLTIYIFEHVQSDFTFVCTYMSAHSSTYSCYLLCCVMVGMCLAAASWQSKNLATRGHNLPQSRRWDVRDRSEAEWTASHGSRWVTLATGRVLASARTSHARQTCVEQVYNKDVVQLRSENERQQA